MKKETKEEARLRHKAEGSAKLREAMRGKRAAARGLELVDLIAIGKGKSKKEATTVLPIDTDWSPDIEERSEKGTKLTFDRWKPLEEGKARAKEAEPIPWMPVEDKRTSKTRALEAAMRGDRFSEHKTKKEDKAIREKERIVIDTETVSFCRTPAEAKEFCESDEWRKKVLGDFPKKEERPPEHKSKKPVDLLEMAIADVVKSFMGEDAMDRVVNEQMVKELKGVAKRFMEEAAPPTGKGGKWEEMEGARKFTFRVIAGDHAQAQRWASIRRIPAAYWQFVDRPDKLRGIGADPFVFVGTYWELDEIEDIIEMLKHHAISGRE